MRENSENSVKGVSSQDIKKPKRKNSWYVATMLLGVRPRSVEEMRMRLAAKGFVSEEVEKVLSKCLELGYLNDRKFAEAVCEGILNKKPVGRRILQFKLRTYKVPEDVREEVISVVFTADREKDLAKKAFELRKKQLEKRNVPKEKWYQKIGQFLAQRGFSAEIVSDLLGHSL